jgi:hypothetical protein
VRNKPPTLPSVIPETLNEAQRAIVEGASTDAARIVLIRLFERVSDSSESL